MVSLCLLPFVVVLAALSLLSSESVWVSLQLLGTAPPPALAHAARMRCRASTVEHLDRLDSSVGTTIIRRNQARAWYKLKSTQDTIFFQVSISSQYINF